MSDMQRHVVELLAGMMRALEEADSSDSDTEDLSVENIIQAKDLSVALSPLTRLLFREEDDSLLDYLNEDGKSVEPAYFLPVIPLVLVNGCDDICKSLGLSFYVPSYNPRDIIANVRRFLNSEDVVPMDPWYRGFRGTIEKTPTEDGGITYTVTGLIEQLNGTNLKITVLPIRRWIKDYKEFLEANMTGIGKSKDAFVEDYRFHYDGTSVHFDVILSEETLAKNMGEGLLDKFKLTASINTSNMYLLDQSGALKKYDSPEEILEEFLPLRFGFYEKRKKAQLEKLELDFLRVANKIRFALEISSGEILVINRKKEDLVLELKQKGYASLRIKDREGSADTIDTYGLDGYDNFTTLENVEKLYSERDKLAQMVEECRKATPRDLWLRDLDALETVMNQYMEKDAQAEA